MNSFIAVLLEEHEPSIFVILVVLLVLVLGAKVWDHFKEEIK